MSPARPRTDAGPCGRLCGGSGWFTLPGGGAGEGAEGPDQGEANDLTRTLNPRPSPADHGQQLAPRCRHLAAAYKNVRFTLELCTSGPFSHRTKMPVSARRLAHRRRNPPASPGVHCSPPAGGRFPPDSRPFQLWSSLERGGVQKCTPVQIPVHPNDITEDAPGVRAWRALHERRPLRGRS